MKRKVVKAGRLRLSPNEEAFVLKEDYERRRKLRLLQVREQERDIALQIREDIKQRRNEQFTRLAEELRAEWEESQTQKIKNLEKLYLTSLKNMGEGHRQAKENEPDLDGLAQQAAERKKRAQMRHKEALKIQKNQKEVLMKQKTRHIKARKEALLVEKERSAKITSLPPPPPTFFENIDVKRIPSAKTNSSTYHHLYGLVNREMDTKQPDPHLAAEEEAKRLEVLQKQIAEERLEQFEKAHVRGFHAMKKIHLAQNQEKLMKELKQLQQEDLARRRQNVARMPPQLVELPYKRSEMKEDWQRELEFAFEDMYNADKKVKGNLILQLEPEPLPTVIDQTQDEELDLSVDQEDLNETKNLQVTEAEKICRSKIDVPLAMKTQQVPSKILFKKLLNKIRSQKSLWTIKSMSEDESETITAVSETESKTPTVSTGTIASEEQTLAPGQEQVTESDALTVESGPLPTEDKPLSCSTDAEKQQEVATQPITTVAENPVLLHPQEEAARIRMSAKQKQIMEIEEQKQKQLELLEQIEQQKLRLETDCFKAQLEEEKRKKTQQTGVSFAPAPCTIISDEDSHRQMIRNYQHQLLEQNRLHKQSVEAARKQLNKYQTMLKERYLPMSATSLTADSVTSVQPQKSERSTIVSEHWDQSQKPKLSPNKYQPTEISKLEQSHFQIPKQSLFSQRQVKTMETLSTSDVLAKQSLESQEHLKLYSQTETQQRDYKLISEDSYRLSRPVSHDRPLMFQDAREISETSRATTFQTLGSQQMYSENSQSKSSQLTEPSSFLPLVAEHSFSSLPAKGESGRSQEALSTKSKSAFSLGHSIISQMQDRSLPFSERITAQQGNLKALQVQLELQKEVLRARQESQEQLFLHQQKELEEQTGLPLFIPLVASHSFTSLPSAKAELERTEDSSLTNSDTTVYSGHHPVVPQIQDRLLSLSQSNLPQQDNFQARREAQEVLCMHKQNELDGRVSSEQATSSTLPSQEAQHTFTSLSFAEIPSGKIQQQYSSKSENRVLSSQSEIPTSQDRSSSFLQQFLPLQDRLKLLQEQLTTQRSILQARHEAQAEFLLQRQKDVEVSKSGQMNSSFSTVIAQDSVTSARAEPRRVQKLCLSDENLIPSNHFVIPTFQDRSLSFPQQENLTTLQEQSHIQRVIQGTKQETRECVHKHSELDKRFSSEQAAPFSSLLQVAESERSQEFMSLKSDSTVPLTHSVNPRFQERHLRLSQQIFPLKDNLEERQEWLVTENRALNFSQKAQESTSSEQIGSSSFIPQLGQLSYTSLPSAVSGTIPEPISIDSDSKIPSSHFQIPQLQDRLLRISQLIQPQQDNLKSLQEQLATQRESVVQSRREAQEKLQSGWKERVSAEQVATPSLLPLATQHSFVLSPLTELERIQESCPTKSDNIVSLSHSEIQRFSDRFLDLSKPVLPQQDNLIALQQHLQAQSNLLPFSEKTQKELVLPGQYKFEQKVSCEQFIQPHLGDLKALQEQLDVQRRAIQSTLEAQEELLLQRLSNLEKRISSEQVGSSSHLPQVVLPTAASERTQEPFPTKSNNTVPSSHPEIPGIPGRLLSLSQSVLPQQDNLVAFQEQLNLQKERVCPNEKTQEELFLNKQSKVSESESSKHALSFPKETEHSFISLPFAEAKSKGICELYSSNNEHKTPSSNFMIPKLQDILSVSQPILVQQDNLGLQKQLHLQREALNYSQKAQEELLMQRQAALQQQIEKHQETLKDFFKDSQMGKPVFEYDLKTQKMEQLREWFPHLQDLSGNDQEDVNHADRSNSDDNQLLSEEITTKQSGEHLDKELGRSSKPPLAKVKCGLDLNQHELSAIQEVESPGSGRTSILGKTDFYQDRDPMRVSVSREQSLLSNSVDHDSFEHQPITQKNVCGDDYDEAVETKESLTENQVEEQEHTYVGSTEKPDKVETQDISHEPLSSITISTGSLLSYENTDLSRIDPESFAEQVDHRPQESTTGKKEETNALSSVIPPIQAIYYKHNSSDAHESPLPRIEELTSDQTHVQQIIDKYIKEANLMPGKTDFKVPTVDFDFPELEHTFPNLHRELFKPLEPQPDFDLLSSSFGISQDSKVFYKNSECSYESQHNTGSSKTMDSFTALRMSLNSSVNTSLNQQSDSNSAHDAAQSFATENIMNGSEQSFQQLLPEFSSQEGSQHADLPSIFSIEARDSPQDMENQNCFSEKVLQNRKKDVHFPVSEENLLSSSDEVNVFTQLTVQHSTPCASTSSECSVKDQSEDRKKRLCFKELSDKGLAVMLENQGLTEDDKNEAGGVVDINPHAEESDYQLCVRTVEMGSPVQTPHSLTIQSEKYFENSTKTDTPEILRNLSQPAQSELFFSSGSLSVQSSVPVWETESGHGIMEEPELTLVSTSDISIAETDFENLTLEEKSENEAKSCFQVNEFPPFTTPETESSDCPPASEDCGENLVAQPAETLQNVPSVPESLQEAFLKRKKAFIERSAQRQKGIRNRMSLSEQTIKINRVEKPTGSSVSCLKGVSKVRLSLPEDRRTAQALVCQRALKAYNQLAEVKQQIKEKARQEAYAENRARARAFHKKTLDKLRAKNTC